MCPLTGRLGPEVYRALGQQVENQSLATADRWVVLASWLVGAPTRAVAVEFRSLVDRHDHVDLAVGMGVVGAFQVFHLDDVDAEAGGLRRRLDRAAIAYAAVLVLAQPALGYGVRKAAFGAAYHIRAAATSKDSTANIRLHAEHVAVSARNSLARIDAIVAAGRKIQAARSAGEALPLARKIALWSKQLTAGSDANGNGKITWVKGEGGLKQAKAHLGYMMQGENIAMMKK